MSLDTKLCKNRIVEVHEGFAFVTVEEVIDWIANVEQPLPTPDISERLVNLCDKPHPQFSEDDILALHSSRWFQEKLNQHSWRSVYRNQIQKAHENGVITVLKTPDSRASVVELYSLVSVEDAKKYLASLKIAIHEISNQKQSDGRPQSQQRWQEQEILRVIVELGYTATALPRRQSGKTWVKAVVREKLRLSTKVFDLAWERCRANKEIQEAE